MKNKAINKKKIIIVSISIITTIIAIILFIFLFPFSKVTQNGITYKKHGFVTYIVTDCESTNETITIPAKIRGLEVKSIGKEAFANNQYLKTIYLPYTVTKINSYAFSNCQNLKKISFSYNIDYIGEYAFSNCQSLEFLDLPDKIKTIEEGAFARCSSLKSITLPPDIEILNNKLFYGTAIEYINIPYGVKCIKNNVFSNCKSLIAVYIPETVTDIIVDNYFTAKLQYSDAPFYNCNPEAKIFCQLKSAPETYEKYWNYSNNNNVLDINWFAYEVEFEEYLQRKIKNDNLANEQESTDQQQEQETSKRKKKTAEAIGAFVIGTIIIVGFIAFFVWMIKEEKESEKEYKAAQRKQRKQEERTTNNICTTCPKCLAINEKDNKQCCYCGTLLKNDMTDEKESDQENTKLSQTSKQNDALYPQTKYNCTQHNNFGESNVNDYTNYIFCSQCHSKNKPQNQYCFNCGNSLKFPLQVEEESHCKTENELKIRIMQLEAQLKLAQSSSMNSEAVEQLRAENRELRQKIDEYTANDDYRKRYPAPYLCESGHWVRSKSEREIDNFLFKHRIRYIFEKEYVYNPKSYPYYPDFYLPDYDLFIEYFGMYEHPKYNEKTKRKLDIYSQDTTKHFEFITFEDDNRLQERLAEICRKYNIPLG